MQGLPTVFLSHSHHDKKLVEGTVARIEENGWKVYVDWNDTSMPRETNKVTAANIKRTIRDARYFLFLATKNSMESVWCPWEIGFADGVLRNEQILIIQTEDDGGRFHGNEYLQLYRSVDSDPSTKWLVLDPEKKTYITLGALR